MIRFLGLFSVIPATILLTVSFFVLFTLSKITARALRGFAIAIVILLWISALLILSVGTYIIVTGQHPLMQMHRAMMKDMMMNRGSMMMRPGEAMPGSGAMQQNTAMPQGKMPPAGSSMRHR